MTETHDQSTAVRLSHAPSGVQVVGDSEHGQLANQAVALQKLEDLLRDTEHELSSSIWTWCPPAKPPVTLYPIRFRPPEILALDVDAMVVELGKVAEELMIQGVSVDANVEFGVVVVDKPSWECQLEVEAHEVALTVEWPVELADVSQELIDVVMAWTQRMHGDHGWSIIADDWEEPRTVDISGVADSLRAEITRARIATLEGS